MVKLQGAFSPTYRLAVAGFMLAVCAFVTWASWQYRALVPGASVDVRLSPISLGIGLLLGALMGRSRLKALRAVVPRASGKPFFTQLSMVSRSPEDQKARRIERIAYVALISLWIVLVPFEGRGAVLPFTISSTYILGMYLTGSCIPFIRYWMESRTATHDPLGGEERADFESPQRRLTSDEEIHLRGAFNPTTQIIWGLIVTVMVGGAAVIATLIHISRIDSFLSPVALAFGLWVGFALGIKRLGVLHEVLPQLNGKFVFAQWDVMMSVPEGATVVKVQGWTFAIAVMGSFGVPAFTNGKVSLVGSFASFGLGAFLTGKILPFIRLRSELNDRNCRISRGA